MKNHYKAIKILSFIGLLLGVYLMWQQLFRPPFQPCYVNSIINCDAVISGPVAKTLGIPTPLYGLVGYSLILFGAFMKKTKLMLSMSTFGVVFCLYLAYVELFQLHVVCPICITCQFIMLAVFGLSIVVHRKEKGH